MMDILEQSLEGTPALSPEDSIKRLQQIGLKTRSESTLMIREDRKRR